MHGGESSNVLEVKSGRIELVWTCRGEDGEQEEERRRDFWMQRKEETEDRVRWRHDWLVVTPL